VPESGETICGDIALETLAPASMGARSMRPVFLANRGPEFRAWVTIVDGALMPTSMDVSRFMAGANPLLELRHPSLCRTVLVDREMSYCVVGYERLDGAETLADLVGRKDADIPLGRTAVDLARGLAFLHRNGFVHGIITPGTVLLWEGATLLWQYGIASLCVPDIFGPRAFSAVGDVVAPELERGDPVSASGDVFGWGAVLATIVSGRSPQQAVVGARAGKLDGLKAAGLDRLVAAALDPDPSGRPQSGVELLRELTAALSAGPVAAPSHSAAPWQPASAPESESELRSLAEQYLAEMNALGARDPAPASAVPRRMTGDETSGPIGRLALKKVEAPAGGFVEKRRATGQADPRAAAPLSHPVPEPEPPRPPPPASRPDPSADDSAAFDEAFDEALLPDDADEAAADKNVQLPPSPFGAPVAPPPVAPSPPVLSTPPSKPSKPVAPPRAAGTVRAPASPKPGPAAEASVPPGGEHPRDPMEAGGWLRPRDPAEIPAGPHADGIHPKWPTARDLGDGLRKRSFGESGAPEDVDAGPTPREGLPLDLDEPDAPTPTPTPTPTPARAAAPAVPADDEFEEEASDDALPRSAAPAPVAPAGAPPSPPVAAVRPGDTGARKAAANYRPPRMPGPHGPPPILLAVALAAVAGSIALWGTIRGVQAHGSVSALFGERGDGHGVAGDAGVAPAAEELLACPDGSTAISGDPDDPMAGICIDKAEYPGWMEMPVEGVAFVEAQHMCAERGGRLCASEEWRRACGGLAEHEQPYGAEYVRGHCKTADSGDEVLARSGQRPQCVSPVGVADLVGNVAEWVAEGVAMGGSVEARKPTCFTQLRAPKKGRANVGFRCCYDVK
jgi:hypothetical protein